MALSYIAIGKILSIDDGSEEANQCAINYEHCRKLLLMRYTWGFSERITKMAILDKTIPGWTYVYGWPEKCLQLRDVFSEDRATIQERAQDNNEFTSLYLGGLRVIATDIETAYAEYTYDATDTEIYSEHFVEALARTLAACMAQTLAGSGNLMQTNLQLAQIAIQSGKVASAGERKHRTTLPTDYARARFR